MPSHRLIDGLRGAAVLVALTVGVLCAACSPSGGGSAQPPTQGSAPAASGGAATASASASASASSTGSARAANLHHVTSISALGDSVPRGTACDCTPYPQLVGSDVEQAAGHPVTTANDAVAGFTSGDVLTQVRSDTAVAERIRQSQAVTLEVGANDVAHSSSCGTDAACYEERLPQLASNLAAVLARIHELTAGQRVTVVLLDYWSVWLGGQYATAQGPAYVDAASALTTRVNDTIKAAAGATGSLYVDLRTAFRGPDDAWDETHLLAPDGDHPNAAGHQRIAEAVTEAVLAAQ